MRLSARSADAAEAEPAVNAPQRDDDKSEVTVPSTPAVADAAHSSADATAAQPADATDAAADLPVVSDTRAAVRGASPIALAGLVANVANIGVTLLVARLLSTRGYGALNQLVAVFFVLSIPGSALLVGIVRRITLWERTGHGSRVPGWAFRTRRRALVLVVAWAVVAIAIRGPLAGQLSLPGPGGLSETLIAGAVWGVLCLERGLLQASHAYRALGANLLVEGLSRCVLTISLVGAGLGVSGAALAILLSVLLAEAHALTAQGLIDRRATRKSAAAAAKAGGAIPVPDAAETAAGRSCPPPADLYRAEEGAPHPRDRPAQRPHRLGPAGDLAELRRRTARPRDAGQCR